MVSARQVGLLLAEVIVTRLLVPGAAITVVVDDTLFRRRGRKVHAAGWFHDGSAAGQVKLGFGNTWVVVAIVVTLPWLSRPVALPVLAALAAKGGQTKPDLARDLVDLLAEHFSDRELHIVADAAYGCGAFCGLGDGMTMTTRAKTNAVFCHLAPPRIGKRGRPSYAARWSIEVMFFDAKHILGVGQARNRVRTAVERTVPFGLFCSSILTLWYALYGHTDTDTAQRRAAAPWYRSKTEPSTLDMLTKLRRLIITARFLPATPRPATTEEILEVQHAWGPCRRITAKVEKLVQRVSRDYNVAVIELIQLSSHPEPVASLPFQRGGRQHRIDLQGAALLWRLQRLLVMPSNVVHFHLGQSPTGRVMPSTLYS